MEVHGLYSGSAADLGAVWYLIVTHFKNKYLFSIDILTKNQIYQMVIL